MGCKYTSDGKVNLVTLVELDPSASNIVTSSGSNVTSPKGKTVWVGLPFLKVLICRVIGIDSDFVLK